MQNPHIALIIGSGDAVINTKARSIVMTRGFKNSKSQPNVNQKWVNI